MRKLLGGAVFVAGVGGLGVYATQGPAVDIQAKIADAAAKVAGTAQHGVAASVSGRDIILSGTIDDKAERAALVSALKAIPGSRVVDLAAVEMLPVASPFFFSVTKTDSGVAYQGNVPSAAIAQELGLDGLQIASGEPENGWSEAAATIIAAVEPLKAASVILSDTSIVVQGTAALPEDRAAFEDLLADLPDGYNAISDIDLEDDGSPLRLSLQYDGAILRGSGKIPANVTADDIALPNIATELDLTKSVKPSEQEDYAPFVTASLNALGVLVGGQLDIEGNSVVLTGTGTPEGIAAANRALAEVPAGYIAESSLSLFDDGEPFSLTLTKSANGIVATGKVPADFDIGTILPTLSADDVAALEAAFISDETGVWPQIATDGIAALNALESGTLEIVEGNISLAGEAFSPTERDAAIAALGAYDVIPDIATRDDGAPLALTVNYTVQKGAVLSGKLPAALGLVDVAEAMGVDVDENGATESILQSETDFLAPLSTLAPSLPVIAALTYEAGVDGATLNVAPEPGVDGAQLVANLASKLGDSVAVNAVELTPLPVPGSTRQNRFSGQNETFSGDYWMPSFDFFPTPASCTAQSDAILADHSIAFVDGSAQLDVYSVRAINALSSLARKCALEGGVFVEVGVHTDSNADPDANLALSQEQAEAVRSEMLDRGLARVVVTAAGFGDTQVIAANNADEGQATNGRTTFLWSFE